MQVVKASNLIVDGVKLIKLKRGNFEYSVTQPNTSMKNQI